MARMSPIDIGTEVGQLLAIAEPFGYPEVTAITPDGLGAWAQYYIECIVRGWPALKDCKTARETRAGILNLAEDFLAALGDGGWQVMEHIKMEILTDVQPFTQTLAGELVEPSEQRGVQLKVILTVSRPR